MKKIIKLISIIIITLIMTGCSTNYKKGDKITITSTIFPGYDFARAVGKENIDLTMLLKPGSESHSYDPTPKDRIMIENSDIFIYVGGESESWVDEILNSMDTKNMKIIRMMDIVEVKEEEIVEGMQHSDDKEEKEYDEHVWTSPINAMKIVEKIEETLIKLDPNNEKTYEKNAENYLNQLEEINNEIKDIVSNAKRTELIFADRFPFRYFTDEYNLTYKAAFPGCSSNTEASAKTIAYLINKVKQDQIPVVFHLELSNQRIANTIIEETNAKTLEFHSAHNITKKELEKGTTYIDIMKNNIKNLKEALN